MMTVEEIYDDITAAQAAEGALEMHGLEKRTYISDRPDIPVRNIYTLCNPNKVKASDHIISVLDHKGLRASAYNFHTEKVKN